jgi:hypothetical protein
VTDDKHQKQVDELIKHDRRITQKQIGSRLGMSKSTSPIFVLHDNARTHIARATIDALETLKFEVLSHSPYSPVLTPSDFQFSPPLKRDLEGTHFT